MLGSGATTVYIVVRVRLTTVETRDGSVLWVLLLFDATIYSQGLGMCHVILLFTG